MENLESKISGLSLIAQEKLQTILRSIPGKKHLIIENSLIKPLEHICSANWLRLQGIQLIYKLDAENNWRHNKDVLIYMIRSSHEVFNDLLKRISKFRCDSDSYDENNVPNHIICVPSCFSQFAVILEAEGLYGRVQLHRFNWDFIFIDNGLLSMEIPNVFSSIFMNGDTSLLPAIAQSIRTMNLTFGRPKLLFALGTHSTNIARLLKGLEGLKKANDLGQHQTSSFDVMIIVDRDVDFASPLLTPTTYAGLLLEVFDSCAGEISISDDSNKILRQKLDLLNMGKSQTQSSKSVKNMNRLRLNSMSDEIYQLNRYKHFTQVSGLIRDQAKTIGIEVKKLNDMKIDEMHEYVARKLPKITSLKAKILRHLNACEKIIEMLAKNFLHIRALEEDILSNNSRKRSLQEIDELLTTDGQKFNTLRLLCLLHISARLSIEELQPFINNYCNSFGANCLTAFMSLANAGLLPQLEVEKGKGKVVASKFLQNLSKFQQTEFQINSNRLRLMDLPSTDVKTPGSANISNSNSDESSNSKVGCPSYVFNGVYIPFVAQICSLMAKLASVEDFATKFGSFDAEIYCREKPDTAFNPKSFLNHVKKNKLPDLFPLRNANFFIYVTGGITYSEVAALNLLESTTDVKIFTASDNLISGSDLINSAFN